MHHLEEDKDHNIFGVLPDALVEADEFLIEAEDLYSRLQQGESFQARTHAGRLRKIEAATKRHVEREIVSIEVEGLPWPLRVTADHPVLINTENGKTDWREAGKIEEGVELLEPIGPGYFRIICYDRDRGITEHNAPMHSAGLSRAIILAFEIEPPSGDYVITADLSIRKEWAIDFALELEGSARRSRHCRLIAGLRREIAEHGLPRTLPGGSREVLHPILRRWGTRDPENARCYVDITPGRVRPYRDQEITLRNPYEPERSAWEACRDAAYTLERAFAETGLPGDVREFDDGFRVTLKGVSAAKFLFSKKAVEENHRKRRPYKGPGRPTCDRKDDPTQYALREAVSVSHRSYEGPAYSFQVHDDESFVTAGIATRSI